jgi:hypothetical protein
MPLSFPVSPSDGEIYNSGTTQWVYSTADGAWQIDRGAIVETTDGLVSGANFANNAIDSSNLNLATSSPDLGTTNTRASGGNTDLITTTAISTGLYYIAAQITYKLSGASEAVYSLSCGASYVARGYVDNDFATYGNIQNTIIVGKFFVNTSAANTIKLNVNCSVGSIDTIGSGSVSYTTIFWSKLGGY